MTADRSKRQWLNDEEEKRGRLMPWLFEMFCRAKLSRSPRRTTERGRQTMRVRSVIPGVRSVACGLHGSRLAKPHTWPRCGGAQRGSCQREEEPGRAGIGLAGSSHSGRPTLRVVGLQRPAAMASTSRRQRRRGEVEEPEGRGSPVSLPRRGSTAKHKRGEKRD